MMASCHSVVIDSSDKPGPVHSITDNHKNGNHTSDAPNYDWDAVVLFQGINGCRHSRSKANRTASNNYKITMVVIRRSVKLYHGDFNEYLARIFLFLSERLGFEC